MTISTKSSSTFTPIAAILAWLWPGLGHISLGYRKRGILVMAGVLFLFLGGILIGGVDVVDRRNDKLWFFAQAVCGPIAFATDLLNQRFLSSEEDVIERKSVSHVNEIGTLFTALAGLMNLVVILDVLHQPSNKKPFDRRAASKT